MTARHIVGALLLVGTLAGCGPRRPNIVLIVTDDQRWDTLDVMPSVQRDLAAEGVTFSQAIIPTPICEPSRASILTGNREPRPAARGLDDQRQGRRRSAGLHRSRPVHDRNLAARQRLSHGPLRQVHEQL